MTTSIENDILFDDVAMLENSFGKQYLTSNAESISPDCNCSGYTETEIDGNISAA